MGRGTGEPEAQQGIAGGKGEQIAQGERGRERSEPGGHGQLCHTRPQLPNPNRASRTISAQGGDDCESGQD